MPTQTLTLTTEHALPPATHSDAPTPGADPATGARTGARPGSALQRWSVLAYGLVVYAGFLGVFLYTLGFVSGLIVPKTLDGGVGSSLGTALAVDLTCLAVFAIQHTIMARPAFKAWWTRIIPPAAERSTFVLVTSLILALTFWQWRALPLEGALWSTDGWLAIVLGAVQFAGFGLVLVSTILIDHGDLFGLRQVVSFFRQRRYTAPAFRENLIYSSVRHPLMTGFLIAFWSQPVMTPSRLLFAAVVTLYICVIGLRFEERDLIAEHGDAYREYRRRVPGLVPFIGRRGA